MSKEDKMSELNYGLALGSNGEYQISLTTAAPGIRDDYSHNISRGFTFMVAPAAYVDRLLCIDTLTDGVYMEARADALKRWESSIKTAILTYHNPPGKRVPRKCTHNFGLPKEITEWEEVTQPKKHGIAISRAMQQVDQVTYTS